MEFSPVDHRFCRAIAKALVLLTTSLGLSTMARADEQHATTVKHESFDRDPQWLAHDNRMVPGRLPTIVQDFGYSRTNFAGARIGEMGGTIARASEPAFYADAIEPKTLDEPLSASGTFAMTRTTAGGGVFFGFFRAEQPGGGGRPISSLGLNLDCEAAGGRLAVRLITGYNQSCGTFITPYLPGKYRTTPLHNDGTRYRWKLDYDPLASGGRGQFTFTLTSDAHAAEPIDANLPADSQQEARRRFPHTTSFAVDLPEGFKRQQTRFDHFGVMNLMKAGGTMTVDFDDLEYIGRQQQFDQDPHWDAAGNRRTYRATDVAGGAELRL